MSRTASSASASAPKGRCAAEACAAAAAWAIAGGAEGRIGIDPREGGSEGGAAFTGRAAEPEDGMLGTTVLRGAVGARTAA